MSIEFSVAASALRRTWAGAGPRAAATPARVLTAAVTLTALAALAALAAPAHAQSSGDGFLFNRPVGSFSLRGGYSFAMAGSQVFDDATSQLTLSRRDFSASAWGADFSYAIRPRIDILFDIAFSSAKAPSEFREFVDNDDEPIEQETRYRRLPLTFGLKYYLFDRGRSIGQFAYIPSKYAPYLGLGGGAMYYKFQQDGDFIDFATDNLEVFSAKLESSGWTPMAHGAAGMDYTVGPWLALTAEARYQWARARLDPQVFEGYDKIDLSGVTGTVGFRVRF